MVTNNSANTNFTVTGSNNSLLQPTRPCFGAKVSNKTISNVTGSGSNYTILFDSVTFDNLSNYNSATGEFTAPATGRYFFTCGALLTNLGASHTVGDLYIFISTGTLFTVCQNMNPTVLAVSTDLELTGSNIISLSSGDKVTIIVNVAGSTATVGVKGAVANTSWFHGFLMD